MAFKQNNPLSRKTSPINRDWIKGAIKRPGAFRKKAEEAGMSTRAFAEKVTANKEDYSARTGKQAELAETLMGMSRDESPVYRHTDKHMKRQAKRKARKSKGDAQDIYYEMKSDKMEEEKKKQSPASKIKGSKGKKAEKSSEKDTGREINLQEPVDGPTPRKYTGNQPNLKKYAEDKKKGSPAKKISEKAAERKVKKGKGRIVRKTGGKDMDAKYISNRRERRANKANDGTLKGITKSQKIKEGGRKIKSSPANMRR